MTLQDYLDLHAGISHKLEEVFNYLPKKIDLAVIQDADYYNNQVLDEILKLAAKECNVDLDDLLWFVFENEYGEKGLKHFGFPINDLHDFLLFEQGNTYKLKNGKVVVCKLEEVEGSMILDVLPKNLTNSEIVETLSYYYKDLD